MRAFVAVCLFASLFLCVKRGYAEAKSLDDHWKDVGLRLEAFTEDVSHKKCSQSFRTLMGCVEGLNAALARHDPPLTLVTPEIQKKYDEFSNIVVEFSSLLAVELKEPSSPPGSFLKQHARKKAIREDLAASLRRMHAAARLRTPWSEIIAFIRRDVIQGSRDVEAVVTAAAMNGMLAAKFDPHTYITPTGYFYEDDGNDSFVGIGINIKIINGKVTVLNPIEGSPALAAGVKAKDVITHVDGESLAEVADLKSAIERISGPLNSKVIITVARNDESISFAMLRKTIKIDNVTSKIIERDGQKLGYIKLRSFISTPRLLEPEGDICAKQFKPALRSLLRARVTGLILDLRGNGGGRLDEAVCIADVFLPRGAKIVSERNLATPEDSRDFFSRHEAATHLPLVTLIDAASASASEIVAGSLQDHGRSILVGVKTFGKGTVQSVRRIGRSLIFAETTARFYLPSGRTNQIFGINPDFPVYSDPDPSDEDRFFLREGDLYTNPLSPEGKPWRQPRQTEIKKLERCVKTTGQAQTAFREKMHDTFAADFQRDTAEDVIICMIER